jgi:hypothetical protein
VTLMAKSCESADSDPRPPPSVSPEGDAEASEDTSLVNTFIHASLLVVPARFIVVPSTPGYASHQSPARRGDSDGEGGEMR